MLTKGKQEKAKIAFFIRENMRCDMHVISVKQELNIQFNYIYFKNSFCAFANAVLETYTLK